MLYLNRRGVRRTDSPALAPAERILTRPNHLRTFPAIFLAQKPRGQFRSVLRSSHVPLRSSVPASICFNRKLSARSQRWQPAHLPRRIGSVLRRSRLSKLTTPQWIGEPGVEAAVILAIDDMNDPPNGKKFLRPILNRLKQIDGRAPVSIMTVSIKPEDPNSNPGSRGLSLETTPQIIRVHA